MRDTESTANVVSFPEQIQNSTMNAATQVKPKNKLLLRFVLFQAHHKRVLLACRGKMIEQQINERKVVTFLFSP